MDYCAVVVPVYASTDERLKYFDDCLKSVCRQSYPTIGVIVDDGSPRFEDVRKIFVNNNNGSLRLLQRKRSPSDKKTASNALNYGLERIIDKSQEVLPSSDAANIRGVCYLHSDDMLTQSSVADRMDMLVDKSVVYSNLFTIDSNSKPILEYGCGVNKTKSCHGFPHHSLMWDINFLKGLRTYIKDKFNQSGIFDKNLCAGEDRDVSISTIRFGNDNGYPIIFLNKPTYLYRKQEDSITFLMSEKLKSEDAKTIRNKHELNPLSTVANRLSHDLPWSLLTYMPEKMKKHFRASRDFAKKFFNSDISGFPESVRKDSLLNYQ